MKHQQCLSVKCTFNRADHSDEKGFYTYCVAVDPLIAMGCQNRTLSESEEGTVSEEHLAWMEYTDHNPSGTINEHDFKCIWTSGRMYGRQQIIEENSP